MAGVPALAAKSHLAGRFPICNRGTAEAGVDVLAGYLVDELAQLVKAAKLHAAGQKAAS